MTNWINELSKGLEVTLVDKQEEEFLKMIGLKGTVPILRFLDEKKEGQYVELCHLVNVVTLNTRLKQLLYFGLIQHHLEKKEIRREWYTITNKGKKILDHVREMLKLVEARS